MFYQRLKNSNFIFNLMMKTSSLKIKAEINEFFKRMNFSKVQLH